MSLEDPTVWSQIVATGGGFLAAIGGILLKTTDNRFKRLEKDKASKELVEQHGVKLTSFLGKLDQHISDEQRNKEEQQEQFRELFRTMHSNHVEVIRELGKKQDRRSDDRD